ncbi:hypothetical protein N9023_07350 [Opitutaceae bacterium]|nr:hypothetical protein [Opitutaceae bacterium]
MTQNGLHKLLGAMLTAGLCVAVQAAGSIEFTPGEIVTRTAAGETDITYHVLTPADYDAAAPPPPIVIAFSPGGDGLGILNKLKDGVSPAGWTLVGCDKLKNGLKDPELALKMEDEVLDDILRTVPHDPSRIYLAGFSGGAMRSYDLTTRRPEAFAGVLAYGGWLGGTEHQGNAFREGMSVAMINGTQDRGAGAWVASDTARLRELNSTIKHYYFVGGHSVSPPEVTAQAVDWMEQQWHAKPTDKSPWEILYVGEEPNRPSEYRDFLSQHFSTVRTTKPDALTLATANRADVLVINAPITSLPDNFPKAMVLLPKSSPATAERYGSKVSYSADSHPDFSLLEEAPDSDLSDRVREAHRLFWNEEDLEGLPAAITFIHDFDGHQQTVYRGLRTRSQLMALLDNPDLDHKTLAKWVAAKLFNQADQDLTALRQLLRENEPFLQIPHGSGLFHIDTQAQSLGTPNHQIASIEKWIELLDDEDDRKAALNLLLTYTGQRIRRQPTKWQTWLDANRDTLRFSDSRGYQWVAE